MTAEIGRGTARGYSRLPFEHGNAAAMKSGFWASPLLRETDRTEVAEIATSLRELMPAYSHAFEPMIEQVSCRVWRQRRAMRDLSYHGLVRDGQPAPLLTDLAKLERQIARDLAELGMTPRSAAALGVDVATRERALSVVEYYRARQDAGLPAHDDEDGDR